ncbi:hypothetical protein [Aquabacterium sp.]|uniref:hypothetical protein n=1 Tax=Aquabacterium sp. TaxID=1872578 RepID=UPI0035AFAC83
MNLNFTAGPTSLDRLDTAIERMVHKHGFQRLSNDTPDLPAGLAVLLLTDDPQRNLEFLDACVILPEALKGLPEQVTKLVSGPDHTPTLLQRYGVAFRGPAVVFLRDGQYVGVLTGIRDWGEYQAEVQRLLAMAPNDSSIQKPIGIPVRVETRQGACS